MTDNLPQITTISETRPLAHTSHLCTVCGRAILPGTHYSRILLRRDDALDVRKALTVVKWHLPYCPAGEA